eukprot:scaffold529183_cov31-Prasinocladus_malaysianus.AAC.1
MACLNGRWSRCCIGAGAWWRWSGSRRRGRDHGAAGAEGRQEEEAVFPEADHPERTDREGTRSGPVRPN